MNEPQRQTLGIHLTSPPGPRPAKARLSLQHGSHLICLLLMVFSLACGSAKTNPSNDPGQGGSGAGTGQGGNDGQGGAGGLEPSSPGDHLATVELEAPEAASFVLRATIPVLEGTFPRPDGKHPLGVLDSNDNLTVAQVQTVSRAPNGSADVVELLSRVQRPSEIAAGERLRYRIVRLDHEQPQPAGESFGELLSNSNLPTSDDVAALASGSIIARARDAFGHVYTHDLLRPKAKVMRYGTVAVQARTFGVLTTQAAQGPPSGALPHLMAIHAYITALADENLLRLDLRVSNAMSGHDPSASDEDALKDIYYESLELELPSGWTIVAAFDDPTQGPQQGNIYPLVTKQSGNKLHVMPMQSHFTRRLVLARTGEESHAKAIAAERGLAFAVAGTSENTSAELYSWQSPETGSYFPQRHFMPSLDHVGLPAVRDGLRDQLNQFTAILASGDTYPNAAYPVVTKNLGPFHPWGVFYGGMTGGNEINPFDGIQTLASASTAGYRFMQIQHRMRSCRQHNRLYRRDGEPGSIDDYVKTGPNGPYAPVSFFNELNLTKCPDCDPFGFGKAPTFQTNHVVNQSLGPDYEETLNNFMVEDHQHLIRVVRTQLTLAWLGNDAMAKDDLLATAELSHMHLNPYVLFYDYKDKAHPGGLLSKIPTTPGQGVFYGRGEFWMTFAFIGAYSTSLDDTWRERKRETFFDTLVDKVLVPSIVPCSGFINVSVNKNTDNKYRSRRGNEAAFGDNVMLALIRSVYKTVDPARSDSLTTLLTKSTAGHIVPGLTWNEDAKAPYTEMPVADKDAPGSIYCSTEDMPAEAYQYAEQNGFNRYEIYLPLAFGSQLSGDPIFTQRADEVMSFYKPDEPTLRGKLEAEGLKNLQNRAPLLACVQLGLCK